MHIYCLKCVVGGMACLGIAGYILLGLVFPRLRGYHHGTQVRLGAFTSVCAAILPFGWGVMLTWVGTHADAELPILYFIMPLAPAIAGSLYGSWVDFRADHKERLNKLDCTLHTK